MLPCRTSIMAIEKERTLGIERDTRNAQAVTDVGRVGSPVLSRLVTLSSLTTSLLLFPLPLPSQSGAFQREMFSGFKY